MTQIIDVAHPELFEIIGVAGFGLYVMNYTLLTFHRLHSHDALYFAINLVAAACVLAGLLVSFNLASALIQLFWVIISTAAIAIRLRRKMHGEEVQHDDIPPAPLPLDPDDEENLEELGITRFDHVPEQRSSRIQPPAAQRAA